MSPALVDAFLLKEDRWFHWHPGVNPVALARAAVRTYGGGAPGRIDDHDAARAAPRRPAHAHADRQAPPDRRARSGSSCATRSATLLEAYLNVVPLGGNVEGVGAASRLYFGKAPDRVTLGEALTLAVIPQRPASARRPLGLGGRRPGRARAQLGRPLGLRAAGDREEERRQRSSCRSTRGAAGRDAVAGAALRRRRARQLDALRAHAARRASRPRSTRPAAAGRAASCDRYLTQYGPSGHPQRPRRSLVDTRDMSVKAWVGSAAYANAASTAR